MNILFIQLPLLDHGLNYIDGNHQNAPAQLTCFIRKKYPHISAGYLHSGIIGLLSDKMIISYILKSNPDIVSFSTYLWNAERNLFIAEQVKKQNSSMKVILGGPEINEESFLFYEERSYVDYFIKGEGEWFFDLFINNSLSDEFIVEKNGNRIVRQPSDALILLSDEYEPYTNNFLDKAEDGSVFIEMTRGCPFKCSYCYYSKNASTVRERSFSVLKTALETSEKRNLKEIYILSPTFNKTNDFMHKLDILKEMNHSVLLHTEIRPDYVTEENAEKIFDAGFRSLEVGLQTLTEKALKKIGRVNGGKKSVNGIKHLVEAGIDIKAGIIPGLPGDTVEGFLQTIHTLQQEGLGECIEFYPLMVLPGTRMREIADNEALLFQKYPPYFITESGDFTFNDIKSFSHYIEEMTGFTATIKRLPDFSEGSSGFTKGIVVHKNVFLLPSELDEYIETSVFNISLKNKSSESAICTWIDIIYSSSQIFTLFHIIVYNNKIFDESVIEERILQNESDTIYSRLRLFDEKRYSYRISLVQVFERTEKYVESCMIYSIIEPVLRITEKNRDIFLDYDFTFVPRILVSNGLYEPMKDYLETMTDYTDYISFENESEKQLFYEDNGFEYSHSSVDTVNEDIC